jgi:dTDP-4-dehydrorhamnose reductase
VSRLVVLGSSGQLGTMFLDLLQARGEEFVALDQADCDLARPDHIMLPLRGARAVINCAAFTAVDAAETEEDLAHKINAEAVGKLASLCKAAAVPLLHFSTDYVFDGAADAPYSIDHPRAPLGAYGRTKARGEELLEASGADYLLVRTSWVYAPWGQNFVRTMTKLLREKSELKVVDDQRGRPTHVRTLAERSLALLDQGQRGTFHVTDDGECTWYGLTLAIKEALGAACAVTPCTTAEFPRPARRPAYSVLDISRAESILGPAPHYLTRLRETVAVL